MSSVTAIVDGEMRYTEGDGEVAELVRVVFAEARPGWAARLFAWPGGPVPPSSEKPPSSGAPPGSGGRAPASQMRIVADLALGWGALNYLLPDPRGSGWRGWDSFDPDHPAGAPELPFGQGRLVFPRSASLRLPTVIDAVQEYCHIGRLPACVQWQGARYY